jgi:Raf kinase inhibitor-like YbhB/YbcL family protein
MATGITVTSELFSPDGTIPASAAHAFAGGGNVSPDLRWSGVPAEAKSLAVTVYDPDAPTTVGFVHWLLFDLDPTLSGLPAGAGSPGKNPAGSILGLTDWGVNEYGGMAPTSGDEPHRYIFTVYALDVPSLGLPQNTTYAVFNFMTRGHVLATGTLTGRFGL